MFLHHYHSFYNGVCEAILSTSWFYITVTAILVVEKQETYSFSELKNIKALFKLLRDIRTK